jgi:hypothetical protein
VYWIIKVFGLKIILKDVYKITASAIFIYDHETKLTTRQSAARRTRARNAFIVTADAK